MALLRLPLLHQPWEALALLLQEVAAAAVSHAQCRAFWPPVAAPR